MTEIGFAKRTLGVIAAEHHELERRAKRLSKVARTPFNDQSLPLLFSELRREMSELSDLLQKHLDCEAAGGYLEEAVARVPALAHRADAIESDHPVLVLEMSGLVEAIKNATPTAAEWRSISRALESLTAKLLAHERAENQILQRGFNEDPALFDNGDTS